MNEPATIASMLAAKTIAVVGLSDDPTKPSHYVSAYMQAAGKRILPVNPSVDRVLGEKSYASLRDLPERPDLVNIFRLPRAIPGLVDEMIELGFEAMWMQLGIRHEGAAIKAEAHDIRVVMDRCIMVDHRMMRR